MTAGGGSVLSRAVHIIDLDDSRFHTGLKAVESTARAGGSRIQGVLKNALAVGVGSSAFTSSIFAIRRGFEFAAEGVIVFNARLDQTTAAFEKLLGNRADAEKQFKELFEFAKNTPFDFDAVLKGATALQVFGATTGDAANAVAGVGKSVLLTNENLKLFGDAAAATVDVTGSLENGFKQSTFWIGRLYQALQNNAPIGRAALSLERLGLLLPEIREQIELAASAGASGDEQFDIFKKSLERFNGLQEAQQKSFFTQISTVQDNITRILAQIGRPAYEGLIDFLQTANKTLESNDAGKFVDDLTAGIQRIATIGKNFLTDPATQKAATTFLKDAANSIKSIVSLSATLVETAKPFVSVLALIVRGVDSLAKGFGTNAITLGALIVLATKFRRALTIGADIATGKQLATNLVRDSSTGNLLTSKERTEQERIREADLRDELAVLEAREKAKRAIVERSKRSLDAAENQVDKNVTGRADRAQKAADTAAKTQLANAQGLVTATRSEQAISTRLAATQQQQVKARQNLLDLENKWVDVGDQVIRKQQQIADILVDQQSRVPQGSSFEDQVRLEQEAKKRLEAQERVIAKSRLTASTIPAGPKLDAANGEIAKQIKQRDEYQQQFVLAGQGKLVAMVEKEKQLRTELADLQRKEALTLKQHETVGQRINQLASVETAQALKRLDATDAITQQQQKLTNGLAGQRILQAKASNVAANGGPTVQELARIANQESTLEGRELALAKATELRVAKQKELAQVTGQSTSLFEKASNVAGRVTQGLFLIALAYEAVNIATGVLFHDSLPGVIESLVKYGDTLGNARKEAIAFGATQKNNADGADEFAKEIDKQKKALEDLLVKQEAQKQANIDTEIKQGDLNPFDPRAIRNNINALRGIDTNRQTDETKAKIKELEDQLAQYNKRWDAINENARAYSGHLDGNIKLTREEITELEKLRKTDPGFDDAVKKLQEESDRVRKALGTSSLAPDIIAQITKDAEKFRDVGQVALKNFLRGFDSTQLSDFSELSDLANKIFESTGREGAVQEIKFGNLQVAIARAVDETQKYGKVLTSTRQEILDIAGGQGGEILELADQLGALRLATEKAAQATERFKQAQQDTAYAEDELNAVLAYGSKIYDELKTSIDAAAKVRADGIRLAQEYATGLKDDADEAARASRKHIDILQEEQRIRQASADTFDREAKKQEDADKRAIAGQQAVVDSLQDGLNKLQEAASQNQAAFQAVMDGRVEQYRRERGELTQTEEAIISRYEKELAGIRRVRDATRDRSDTLSREQRAQLLAFSEAIERARRDGNKAEVARLTRERARYQQRSQRPIDLAAERATVAQDQFDTAAKSVTRAAEEQGLRDKEAINVASKQLDAATLTLTQLQHDAEVRQAANDEIRATNAEAIRIAGETIDAEERAAKKAADDAAEQIRLADNVVKVLQKADSDQKERDDDALTRLKNLNDIVANIYKDNVSALKGVEDASKRVADLATEDAKKQQDIVDRIKLQNGLMDTQVGYLDKILKALQGANITINPTPNPTTVDPRGEGGLGGAPGANVPSPGAGAGGSAKNVALPNPSKKLDQAPNGYHDEVVGGNYYWIPDGFEYDPSQPGNIRPKPPASTVPRGDTAGPGGGQEPEPTGPHIQKSLTLGSNIKAAGLGAGLGANGRFASASVSIPDVGAGARGVPTIDPTAGGLTVNGPLIGAATIREDADAMLIGEQIVAGMDKAFEQNSKRGFLRTLGGKG